MMSYKSKEQIRFVRSKPVVDRKWDAEHSTQGELPENKKSRRKK